MKRIISFNLNGLRSALNKGLKEWVLEKDADVYLFQEIKIDHEALQPLLEGWGPYHWYYFPAEKKGYSGVATLCKEQPQEVVLGCGHPDYDREGRCLLTDFGAYTVMNLYLPSGTMGDVRQTVKDQFLEFFLPYIQELRKKYPNLVISGDYNIAHTPKDIHDPVRNKDSSGFLPHEREWMTRFLETGMVDSLRAVNQEPHQYTWWSYRSGAKKNNKGWRIDYHLVTEPLQANIQNQIIYAEVNMSDHCPLELVLNV